LKESAETTSNGFAVVDHEYAQNPLWQPDSLPLFSWLACQHLRRWKNTNHEQLHFPHHANNTGFTVLVRVPTIVFFF
jgi:hypothetical protein